GDPRGHWEGDTLVIESTNFRGGRTGGRGSVSETGKLTEKFTRVDQKTLKYEVTVDDPATYAKPFTAVLFLKQAKDQVYEYACHEGTEAMSGRLGGQRARERQNAAAPSTSCNQAEEAEERESAGLGGTA